MITHLNTFPNDSYEVSNNPDTKTNDQEGTYSYG